MASLGVTALGAQFEGPTLALLASLVLVALTIGAGVLAFGEEVLPAAALAMLGVLLFGVAVRDVMPLPATAIHVSAPAERLLWSHVGTMTTSGGKYSRPTTHRVVPLVPASWTTGSPLPVWVLDPPPLLRPGAVSALRLSRARGDNATEAWESALEHHHLPRPAQPPSFVELTAQPEAEHARRVRRAQVVGLIILGLWVFGQPIAARVQRPE